MRPQPTGFQTENTINVTGNLENAAININNNLTLVSGAQVAVPHMQAMHHQGQCHERVLDHCNRGLERFAHNALSTGHWAPHSGDGVASAKVPDDIRNMHRQGRPGFEGGPTLSPNALIKRGESEIDRGEREIESGDRERGERDIARGQHDIERGQQAGGQGIGRGDNDGDNRGIFGRDEDNDDDRGIGRGDNDGNDRGIFGRGDNDGDYRGQRDGLQVSQENGKNYIYTDPNTRIELNKANSQWQVEEKDQNTGEWKTTMNTHDDPHTDVDGDGKSDMETKKDWTLALKDGTKITCGTTPYGNGATLSDKLTITNPQGQAVQVSGLASNDKQALNVSGVTNNGDELDQATNDGSIVYQRDNGAKGAGEYETEDGQVLGQTNGQPINYAQEDKQQEVDYKYDAPMHRSEGRDGHRYEGRLGNGYGEGRHEGGYRDGYRDGYHNGYRNGTREMTHNEMINFLRFHRNLAHHCQSHAHRQHSGNNWGSRILRGVGAGLETIF